MKKEFPGYFPPSEADIENRWSTAIVALDASFLLGLYTLTPTTRGQIIAALKTIKSRLFLPNQASKEFHKNRFGVIKKLRDEHDQLVKELDRVVDLLTKRGHKNPTLSRSIRKQLIDSSTAAKDAIARSKSKAEALLKKDDILEELLSILDGKSGKPFDDKELKEIYKDGQQRYSQKIPPGYKDEQKPEPDRYGDLVIWKEILKKGHKHHMFFVTRDEKDDWWWIFEEKKIGPRPELVAEALAKNVLSFHLYTGDRFLDSARRYGNAKITSSSIKEIKESQVQPQIALQQILGSAMQQPGVSSYLTEASAQTGNWGNLLASTPQAAATSFPNLANPYITSIASPWITAATPSPNIAATPWPYVSNANFTPAQQLINALSTPQTTYSSPSGANQSKV
ncbi:MAG: DUF4935 domain-containing protein [Opitutae bacterium]|nr:DUF4935 domain-containing protein [Opitutae bacterium]